MCIRDRSKLLVKKSEIRIGLVFRPYSMQKNQRMRDRVRKVIQTQKQLSKHGLPAKSTELIFVSDEEDEDYEDSRLNKRQTRPNVASFQSQASISSTTG